MKKTYLLTCSNSGQRIALFFFVNTKILMSVCFTMFHLVQPRIKISNSFQIKTQYCMPVGTHANWYTKLKYCLFMYIMDWIPVRFCEKRISFVIFVDILWHPIEVANITTMDEQPVDKMFRQALRKHTYSSILKNLPPKKWKFSDKNSDIFHISAQNIDCGYSLEPPRRGGSNEYPQSMFLSRNMKNNVYPYKPQFSYIKVGFKGVKTI